PRPPLAAPPVQVARANAPVNPPPAVGVPAQPIKLRKANDAARGRALHLVAVGDEDFRAQKYVEAASRYRRAAQGAPDLAEAHFRHGVTEIALARYESAAKSCKKGLEADPGWIAAGFRLANLYGPNQAAKTAHLERLAQEAAARPGDADLRFLIGVELYLDGEYARARKFFEQAAALHAGDDAHLLAFLRELDRRAPEPRDDAVDL
ncbi:MAG: hypothetical protein JNG90_01060, partial [Planctomycetaceae bacterium]|nr:hypothetical protein [Planctomycetaceae bacterium]